MRERYADEGPRVVVVCDRSPGLAFYSPPLPWLDKSEAMRHALELVIASSAEAAASSATSTSRTASRDWLPPRGERRLARERDERLASDDFSAPPDSVERCLEHLFQHSRIVTAGSFVFVCSRLPLAAERARRGSQPSSTFGTSYLS